MRTAVKQKEILELDIKSLLEERLIFPNLKKFKNIIGLYKDKNETDSELKYLIVLNNDTPEERWEIRKFTDEIEFDHYEFDFRFIPKEIIDKVENITKIKYD